MLSCRQCRERLYPDDPSIRVGPYHLSSCEHYCNKPTYFRDLEQNPEPVIKEVIHRHADMSKQEFAKLQDLIGQVAYLQNKIEELSKPKKKPETKYGYRGIK